METRLEIRLLGGLDISMGGAAPFGSARKNKLLLAAVASRGPAGMARERLIDLLWGERGERQARDSLRQALAATRRALGVHRDRLRVDRHAVVLDGEGTWTDALEFEDLASSRTRRHRDRALELYRGELLDGVRVKEDAYAAWLAPWRERLHAKAIQLLGHGIDTAFDVEDRIALALRMLQMEPTNETAHRALMRSYLAQGRENVALKQFEICRDILHRELDIHPGKRTVALYDEIKGRRLRGIGGDGGGATLPPMPDRPSIAVLPFANLSGDEAHGHLADGIAENIITALSKVSRLRVIARNSTASYRGPSVDPRRIADELRVRYILDGGIRGDGERLRIDGRLIDATDGGYLWAEQFDRTVADLFDIQDEITKEIVTALRVKLTDGEEALVWARGTSDIDAWQLCARATELFMRFNTTDYLEARSLAERAIEIDPDYAQAWATLGFTYWWDGRLGYTGDVADKFQSAHECAERAMTLDDTVSWSIGLGAMVAAPLQRHDEGVAIARRGIALYPGNADVRAFLAFALTHAAEYDEAVEHYRAAMSLNPFYPNWYRNGLARTLMVLGEFDETLKLCDEILATEPGYLQAFLQRAFIHQLRGREAEARKAIDAVRRLAPNLRVDHLPNLLLTKDRANTRRYVDTLRQAGVPAG